VKHGSHAWRGKQVTRFQSLILFDSLTQTGGLLSNSSHMNVDGRQPFWCAKTPWFPCPTRPLCFPLPGRALRGRRVPRQWSKLFQSWTGFHGRREHPTWESEDGFPRRKGGALRHKKLFRNVISIVSVKFGHICRPHHPVGLIHALNNALAPA